uniref:Uncharacterized protein n=1 Tax=Cacopsylla melanoneura TaxID=428564 RepID=A0A8D8QGX1_9HEMI
MRGETIRMRTTPAVSFDPAFDLFTICPKMTLIRHVTDDDFREVDEWGEQANIYDLGSSESAERRREFAIEKYNYQVKRGWISTTTPIIATYTRIDTNYSTCFHMGLDEEEYKNL